MIESHSIHEVETDDLVFILDDESKTASVKGKKTSFGEIIIPRSVNQNSQEYIVTTVLENAFKDLYMIESIKFPIDSEIRTICKNAFAFSSIESLTIPSDIDDLQYGWCKNISHLTNIQVIKRNVQNVMYFDDKFLIGKSDQTSSEFDVILFARCDLKNVEIPSFIKRIGPYSFSLTSVKHITIPPQVVEVCNGAFQMCFKMKQIEFTKDSKLQIIGKRAFAYLNVQTIILPSSVVEIRKNWIKECISLTKIQIIENNVKNIIHYDDQFIIGKSDTKSSNYDVLIYSKKYVSEVKIPSFIKIIGSCAFISSVIRKVTIPSQVTKICNGAFLDCFYLKKVKILKNSQLKKIGKYAFASSGIGSISIPSHVTKISANAFRSNSNLQIVKIGKDSELRKIGKGAFDHSYMISTITIPSSVELEECWCESANNLNNIKIIEKEIKNTIKYEDKFIISKSKEQNKEYDLLKMSNRNLKETTIPTFIKQIGPYSFASCSIETIIITPQVTKICDNAFKKCGNLKHIEIPSNSCLQIIGKNAFFNSSIESISIPPSVTEIDDFAFSRCSKLQKIDIPINSELRVIGEGSFGFTSIESILIPSKVEVLREAWCVSTPKLHDIIIMNCEKANIFYYNNQFIIGKSDKRSTDYDVLLYANHDIKEVTIPSFIKKIGPFAFQCTLIEKVIIPPQVAEICQYAFSDSELHEIEFQSDSQLRIIGEYSFYRTKIKKITIPPHVKVIFNYAFDGCDQLENIDIPENSELRIFGISDFSNSSIKSFFIPPLMKNIHNVLNQCYPLENLSFSPHSQMQMLNIINIPKKITIPSSLIVKNSLQSRNEKAQDIQIIESNERNITYFEDKFIIGKSDRTNKDYDVLLYAKNDMKDVIIPPSIKRIPDSLFAKSSIEKVKLTSQVTEICQYAFSNCKKLRHVEIPVNSNLQIIGKKAFNASSIESIFIPQHVTKICKSAFNECENLQKIEFANNSKLQIIGSAAFSNTPVVNITIPSQVTVIGASAFDSCEKLEKVDFMQNSQLRIIKLKAFSNCSIKSIIIPSHVTRIESYAFGSCTNLQNIDFGNNSELQFIGEFAFSHCQIESITIPSHVIQIEDSTFYDCNNLKKVEFTKDSELRRICKCAFLDSSIETITIPSSVELEECWCEEANNLNDIRIIEQEKRNIIKYEDKFIISKSKEQNKEYDLLKMSNRNLKETTIPAFIKQIGPYSFANCSIETIIITPQVTKICDNAFIDCSKLRKVEVMENSELQIIGKFAFSNSSIESITIPSSIVTLKGSWCQGAQNLKDIRIFDNKVQNICKLDDKFIIGKSDIKSLEYDVLIYARPDIKNAIIPSFIKKIGSYVFSKSSIKKVTIPSNLTEICSCAFAYCQNLQKIEIPSDSKLRKIGKGAFYESSISRITIPQHVIKIGECCFSGCQNLKFIDFQKNSELEKICNNAFSNSSIQSILIPPSVQLIGDEAFEFCYNLQIVEYDENSKMNIQFCNFHSSSKANILYHHY